MINEQLLQYIKKQREAGTADEKIKEKLRSAGWKDEDIADGFDAVSNDKNSPESHQQMRQKARQQQSSQTESRSDSVSNQQPNQTKQQQKQEQESEQKKKEESDTSSQQNSQQTQQTKEGKKKGGQKDDYREPVTDADKQGAGAAGPSRPAANENPTPLRTMEADRQRVQGGGEQESAPSSVQKKEAKNSSSKQQTDQSTQEELESAVKEQVEKQKAKRQQKKGERSQQKQSQQKQQSKQRKKGSVSKLNPKPSKKGGRKKKRQDSNKQRNKSRIQQARKQSSSSGTMTILLSLLGLLLIGGGAAYAYLTYFQAPSANTNAQAVLESLANSQSFQYRIGVSNQANGNSEELVIEGAVDTNPNTPAQSYYTISGADGDASPTTGLASEFSQYPDLDPRKQQAIKQALDNQQFLQVGEFQTSQKLGVTENSSGFQTHRFGVSVNPERLFSTYSTIYQEVYGESIDPQLASTLQNNLGNFTPEQGQLWVHPTTSVPYQLTVVGSNADGENVQVNMQFKNHGEEIAAVTNAYESRSVIAGLKTYLGGTSTDSQNATTTTSTSSSNDTENNESSDQNDESTTTSTADQSTDTEAELQLTRRQDQIRINDVEQIVVALQLYASKNNQYPRTLSGLRGGEVFANLPRDPETGQPYPYRVTGDGSRYHLGATLRATDEREISHDANFNSAERNSFTEGFNGSADGCTNENQDGSMCYDRTRSIDG